MYNLEQLEGKIATFILNSGREVLCEVLSVNEDKTVVTANNPRYITFNAQTGEANMVAMTVTSNESTVYLNTAGVLTVMEATETVADEYRNIIADEIIAAEDTEEPEED